MLVLKTIVNIYAVISKPDGPSLIEAIRALAGLEGVEGGEHNQQEGEEEAGHEPALMAMMMRRIKKRMRTDDTDSVVTNLFNSRADQDPLVEEVDVQRLGWRDDQPHHIYANLSLKVKSGKCFCLVLYGCICGVSSQDLSIARLF